MFTQLFKKHHSKNKNNLVEFKKRIIELPENSWILEDRFIMASFKDLFERIPDQVAAKFLKDFPIAFLKASGRYACALSANDRFHIIILFPEVIKSLKGPRNYEGLAILAHELGHLYHEHSKKNIDPLLAQIEADLFACKLGLGHELQDFLLEGEESIEKRVRVAKITAYLLTKEH